MNESFEESYSFSDVRRNQCYLSKFSFLKIKTQDRYVVNRLKLREERYPFKTTVKKITGHFKSMIQLHLKRKLQLLLLPQKIFAEISKIKIEKYKTNPKLVICNT
jgi:hypothetical protein